MPLKINGATSGSVTLAAPATGSDVTLTLPGTSGTAALTASPSLSDPTFTGNVVWSSGALRTGVATVATDQTTTSTSYTDLATVGPSVTVTTGTKALVIIRCLLINSVVGFTSNASVAVSGASTVSASDAWSVAMRPSGTNGQNAVGASVAHLFTGLTAGSNTFTMKYRVEGNTGTFFQREIIVIDMGS